MCWEEFFTIFLAILLKIAIVIFIVVLMTYTTEIFPTNSRSAGYGICMMVGNTGSIFAPLYINYIVMMYHYNPLRILCLVGFIGFLISFRLE